MISDQIIALQQQMYVAHGTFHDAIVAYQTAQRTQAPAEVLFQALAKCQTEGEHFDQVISRLLHHLQGMPRSEEGEVIAAQAQHFRDQLRAESHQITGSQG
ncbi:MAG TPA: hypothetical protein VFS21_13870 [Roseiflexaceae bacterium]|nr:hypothetical protein [Roseiflexaceae bacterium]